MNNIFVQWDNAEQTIIRLTLYNEWTWQELYAVNNDVIALMNSTDQRVHLLIDYMQTAHVPMGGVITHMRNILGTYPPNCDLRICITRSILVQRLVTVFQATFRADLGKRVYMVTSDEDAYRLILKNSQAAS